MAETTSSRPFELEERVRWADVDLIGIMRYSAYTRLVEMAEQELMRAAGMPYGEVFDNAELMYPRRAMTLEYFAPVRIDDLLRLRAYVSRVGETSLTFSTDMYAASNGQLVATASVTVVCVRVGTFEKQPVADAMRTGLAPFTLSEAQARALPLGAR